MFVIRPFWGSGARCASLMQRLAEAMVAGLAAVAGAAEFTTAVLRQGDTLGADVVTAVQGTTVNGLGGYAISIVRSGTAGTRSAVWGSATPTGAPGALRTEGTIGALVQDSFEAAVGFSDAGSVCYSASGSGGPVGGFDSVFVDDAPIALEGAPHQSLPGLFWSFASRPGMTASGQPYFVGGTRTTAAGTTSNRGLFYGSGATTLLLGGQTVPGLPAALTNAQTVSFDTRFSAAGTHYLAEVEMVGATTSNNVMVYSGAGLTIGGALVREGSVLPVSAGGGAGELWQNFDFVGVNEFGRYFFTGDSNIAGNDEFVLLDGRIVLREGGTLTTGETVGAFIDAGAMNENGDWAVVWDLTSSSIGPEILICNNRGVLKTGDTVDWDGDGVLDANAIVDQFEGISSLSLTNRDDAGNVQAYVPATVVVAGVPREAALRVSFAAPRQPGAGDMDCDGVTDFDDITPFVVALTGRPAYEAAFPDCIYFHADADADGRVSFDDISAFVDLLIG